MKKIQRSATDIIPRGYMWIGLILLFLFSVLPYVYLVTTSFSNQVEINAGHLFPQHPTLSNYRQLFSPKDSYALELIQAMRNSLEASILTTIIALIFGSMAAYAFARIKFPFRMTGLFAILSMQVLPTVSIVVPLYMMFRNGFGIPIPFTHYSIQLTGPLLNTPWALIISYASGTIPYVVWMVTGYFSAAPKELEEAAYIDGCGLWGTMIRIILPLSLPGLAATFIFSVLNNFDEFMFANAFTSTYASKTVPLFIAELVGKHSLPWGLMCAAGVVATIPFVILSMICYRWIVTGVTAGAVKG
ncbi:carbohydrate ABC transporter permease [Pullulanibacillus sp. KACC 23026]|uniref:carbohydrate ABC transporter permease n=1 Tax=Pullulanibacillus sp. KACC 23026 TaxID=3028315 RepID=UPI0023B083E7|nr:carbohydrate ABC transporter permease [Pullulanibacillus sp. KACC 23026]WEG10767.1 carbohydrate ABC transporter permease [Pullulanibacillus sp. KACC 23026]